MSKVSIGQHGVQVEIHEKNNVMTPFHTMASIVIFGLIALILLSSEIWIKIFAIIIISVYVIVWLVVYCYHSIKQPELLQSESYRIEKHRIEAGMIEDKQNNPYNSIETQSTNIINPHVDNKEVDNYDTEL